MRCTFDTLPAYTAYTCHTCLIVFIHSFPSKGNISTTQFHDQGSVANGKQARMMTFTEMANNERLKLLRPIFTAKAMLKPITMRTSFAVLLEHREWKAPLIKQSLQKKARVWSAEKNRLRFQKKMREQGSESEIPNQGKILDLLQAKLQWLGFVAPTGQVTKQHEGSKSCKSHKLLDRRQQESNWYPL